MKKYTFLLSFISLAIVACEKVIDLDVPYEKPSLVVNGFLNPDSSISVHLSKSQFVLDNGELKPVADASIRLFQGEEELGFMGHQGSGIYRMEEQKPKVGSTYTLRVDAKGFEPVEVEERAMSKITPTIIEIDTIRKQEGGDMWSYEYLEYTIDLKISDPANSQNFYLFKVFEKISGSYQPDPNEEPVFYEHLSPLELESPDPMLESFCNFGCGLVLTDEYFDGKDYRIKLAAHVNINSGGPNREEERQLTLGMYHISEATYLYYKTLEVNRNTEGDPFAEPAKVFSNVVGGFGILGATSATFVDLPL